MVGSLNNILKFLVENSRGINEVIWRLPVGLTEEITTRYKGKSEKKTTVIATAWRQRFSRSHFFT
jgi:hypothetical protein